MIGFCQCGLGSIPGLDAIFGLSLLAVYGSQIVAKLNNKNSYQNQQFDT